MQRTSGRFQCSNCDNIRAVWRLRFLTDERGKATIYAYCDECRCMLNFEISAAQIKKWEREGALVFD